MIIRHTIALILGIALFGATPCFAKGTTVQLTITGPGLALPAQTNDRDAIAAFVWGSNFFEDHSGPVARPGESQPMHTVYFWVRFTEDAVQMKYVVEYAWQAEEQRAVICFPGPRDVWYRNNTFTVLREGIDGNCYRADEAWGRAIHDAIVAHQ